jgi:DNA-binding NarL/FixJ family response regulator
LQPALPVLVLSIHDEALYAERAIRAGAKGYLMKQEATEQVLTAIRTVLRGEVFLSAKMHQQLSPSSKKNKVGNGLPVRGLTDRELEVLRLIGKSNGTRQIAQELRLSTSTVETHREHIKEKLELKTAIALLQYATRWVEVEGAG